MEDPPCRANCTAWPANRQQRHGNSRFHIPREVDESCPTNFDSRGCSNCVAASSIIKHTRGTTLNFEGKTRPRPPHVGNTFAKRNFRPNGRTSSSLFSIASRLAGGGDINSTDLNRVGFSFGSRSGRLLFSLLGDPLLGCNSRLYSPALSHFLFRPPRSRARESCYSRIPVA